MEQETGEPSFFLGVHRSPLSEWNVLSARLNAVPVHAIDDNRLLLFNKDIQALLYVEFGRILASVELPSAFRDAKDIQVFSLPIGAGLLSRENRVVLLAQLDGEDTSIKTCALHVPWDPEAVVYHQGRARVVGLIRDGAYRVASMDIGDDTDLQYKPVLPAPQAPILAFLDDSTYVQTPYVHGYEPAVAYSMYGMPEAGSFSKRMFPLHTTAFPYPVVISWDSEAFCWKFYSPEFLRCLPQSETIKAKDNSPHVVCFSDLTQARVALAVGDSSELEWESVTLERHDSTHVDTTFILPFVLRETSDNQADIMYDEFFASCRQSNKITQVPVVKLEWGLPGLRKLAPSTGETRAFPTYLLDKSGATVSTLKFISTPETAALSAESYRLLYGCQQIPRELFLEEKDYPDMFPFMRLAAHIVQAAALGYDMLRSHLMRMLQLACDRTQPGLFKTCYDAMTQIVRLFTQDMTALKALDLRRIFLPNVRDRDKCAESMSQKLRTWFCRQSPDDPLARTLHVIPGMGIWPDMIGLDNTTALLAIQAEYDPAQRQHWDMSFQQLMFANFYPPTAQDMWNKWRGNFFRLGGRLSLPAWRRVVHEFTHTLSKVDTEAVYSDNDAMALFLSDLAKAYQRDPSTAPFFLLAMRGMACTSTGRELAASVVTLLYEHAKKVPNLGKDLDQTLRNVYTRLGALLRVQSTRTPELVQ